MNPNMKFVNICNLKFSIKIGIDDISPERHTLSDNTYFDGTFSLDVHRNIELLYALKKLFNYFQEHHQQNKIVSTEVNFLFIK